MDARLDADRHGGNLRSNRVVVVGHQAADAQGLAIVVHEPEAMSVVLAALLPEGL